MDCEYDYSSDSDDKTAPQHHNNDVKQGFYSFYEGYACVKYTLSALLNFNTLNPTCFHQLTLIKMIKLQRCDAPWLKIKGETVETKRRHSSDSDLKVPVNVSVQQRVLAARAAGSHAQMLHIAGSGGDANTLLPQSRWTQICRCVLPRTTTTWEKLSGKCQKTAGSHQTHVSVQCNHDEGNKAADGW